MPSKDFIQVILNHIIAISRGDCRITDEEIMQENDEQVRDILTGLLVLAEDLEFSRSELVEANTELECKIEHRVAEARLLTSELKENEERFRTIIEHNINTMLLLGSEGRIVLSNQQAERDFQYSKAEFNGLKMQDLIPKGFSDLVTNQVDELEEGIEARRKDGSVFYAAIDLNPLTIKGEEYIMATVQDITERKKNAEALVRQKNELQEFAYIATHDLKVPIANIEGYVGLLKDDLPSAEEQCKEWVDWIEKSVEQSKGVIEDLTTVTRFRNLTEQEIPIRVEDLYTEIRENLHMEIQRRNVQIETDFSACPEIVFGRAGLRSVLQNLMSNAIKYRHPDRSPELKIQTYLEDNQACLVVEDNGLGIDLPTQYDKLFGLFKRVHAHEEGSGIGLYMIKKLIEDRQGKIEVESQVNVGTRFLVCLKQ